MVEFLYESVDEPTMETYEPVDREQKIIEAVAGTWEETVMKTSPTGYALMKTALDFIPFGWTATKSGRMEFDDFHPAMKAASVALDVATVGMPVIGKGIKSLVASAKAGKLGKLPFNLLGKGPPRLTSMEKAEEAIIKSGKVKGFVHASPVERVMEKFKLTSDEAQEVMKTVDVINAPPPEMWYKVSEQSGAYMYGTPPRVQALYNKTGGMIKKLSDEIKYYRDVPSSQQMLDHYVKQYDKVSTQFAGKVSGFDPERLFNLQARKFFGNKAEHVTLRTAHTKLVTNMILDLLDNPREVSHLFDPGYAFWTPRTWLPVRKASGIGEALFGTYTKVYEKATAALGARNKYEYLKIADLHKRMSENGFGELIEKKVLDKQGNVLYERVKFKQNYTKREWEDLGIMATSLDRLASIGAKQDLRVAEFLKYPEKVQDMYTKVWKPWHDSLWQDHFHMKTTQIMESHGLTQVGREGVKRMLWGPDEQSGMVGRLSSYVFNTTHDIGYKAKVAEINNMLKTITASVDPSWFTKRSDRLMQETLETLKKEFTPKKTPKDKGFLNYLDDYAMRIHEKSKDMAIERSLALTGKQAAYTKMKTLKIDEMTKVEQSTSRLIERRARAQASELFLYPEMDKVVETIKGLPQGYKDYYEHWVSRMLGEPSDVDVKMATWLTSTIGGVEARWFGGKGVWDGQRVLELGHRINDLVYMGGLGFKPFSAIKNLFQTLITVPTDMGGTKDIYWMSRGFVRGTKKETRDYITQIGAIQEYAPEIYLRARTTQFGPNIKGVQLPTGEKLRDVAMWMFQNTDKFNRYVTGGAVLEKWDYYARKFLTAEHWSPKNFMDKMNFHKRDQWIEDKLKTEFSKLPKMIRSSDDVNATLAEAKKIFVKDVIADTQWLYGIPDSPLITSKYGAVSRTGLIFQSYWMNYMAAIEKWFRGAGRLDRNFDLDRFISFGTSAAIAGSLMTRGLQFNASTAGNMILLGPMPSEISQFSVPPTAAPIYYSLAAVTQTIKEAGKFMAGGEFEFSNISKRLKALGRSTFMFAPGGSFVEQLVKRSLDEGWQGFAKSIVGVAKSKD